MKRYSVVCCPYCSGIFITSARKRVRCIYCGRSFRVRDRTIYSTPKIYEAREKFHQATKDMKITRYKP